SQEEDEKSARDGFLVRAAAQFEKTLEIDSEDAVAHEFLAKCLNRLTDSLPISAEIVQTPTANDQRLLELSRRIVSAPADREPCIQAARHLASALSNPASARQVSLFALFQIRRSLADIAQVTQDEWLRLAVTPVLHAIDQRLLEEAMPLAQRFAADGSAVA